MHLYLIGIGGSGISAIARVLLGRGYQVSGSDMNASARTADLEAKGATVHIGHHAANLNNPDAVIISSAIPKSNPEVAAALDAGIPVLKRSDFLGMLMEGSINITVAGSHGKTTTTSMIGQILMDANEDPSLIVGSEIPSLGVNGRAGQGNHFVIEADEYDNMFLGLRPELAVITNIGYDHPDIFPTKAIYRAAYQKFANLVPKNGRLILCADDEGCMALADAMADTVEITTYGIKSGDWQAVELRSNAMGGTDFVVESQGDLIGLARITVPGEHNVLNALAAIMVALDLGVGFGTIQQSLAEFGGVARRFQIKGDVAGVTVVDDYAHHPTEIQATLSGARQRYNTRRIWAVWQPHTFSRTKLLQDEFAASFVNADKVIALDIFRSREVDTLGIDSQQVVAKMIDHPSAIHVAAMRDAADYILDRVLSGDVVITLGAGDGDLVGKYILDGLTQRVEKSNSVADTSATQLGSV